MAKMKTQYVCSECGYMSAKWAGQCQGCGSWNTLIEEVVEAAPAGRQRSAAAPARIVTFDKIPAESEKRFLTGIDEFDRVLGGGVVPGGVTLAGGEPGIGKSTLFLQVAKKSLTPSRRFTMRTFLLHRAAWPRCGGVRRALHRPRRKWAWRCLLSAM